MEKIDFEILNLLDESEDSEHFSKNFELFLKNPFLKTFTSVLTYFVWEKLILRFSIFWMNQKILSIFQKNFYYEENVFLTLRSEENIFLTAQSEENIVLTELCYKLL